MTVLLDTSVVIKVEVLAGMRPHEEQRTPRLLDGIEWIAVDDLIATTVHATTAMQEQDAQLWTRNVRHFPMFANLEPPY